MTLSFQRLLLILLFSCVSQLSSLPAHVAKFDIIDISYAGSQPTDHSLYSGHIITLCSDNCLRVWSVKTNDSNFHTILTILSLPVTNDFKKDDYVNTKLVVQWFRTVVESDMECDHDSSSSTIAESDGGGWTVVVLSSSDCVFAKLDLNSQTPCLTHIQQVFFNY